MAEFKVHQVVKHMVTGGYYVIIEEPHHRKLMKDGGEWSPFYTYMKVTANYQTGEVFLRAAGPFEGRFVDAPDLVEQFKWKIKDLQAGVKSSPTGSKTQADFLLELELLSKTVIAQIPGALPR